MSKMLVHVVLELYDNIIRDVAVQVPSMAKETEQILLRLHKLVETRGLRVLTIDFPELGKALERSLEHGQIVDNFPHVAGYVKGAGPRLFLGLFQLIFDKSGLLLENYSVEAVFFLRQIFYAAKKLRMECSDERTYAAVQQLMDTDARLPIPTLQWDSDGVLCDSRTGPVIHRIHVLDAVGIRPTWDPRAPELKLELGGSNPRLGLLLTTLQSVADGLVVEFGEVPVWDLKGRHGKGAVSDGGRQSWKYHFPSWGDKLSCIFPYDWHGLSNPGFLAPNSQELEGLPPWPTSHEGSSKLIAVPKTQKTPRLIASEPTAHQWMQQAVQDFLRSCVRRSSLANCIDFLSQEPSRELCLTASKTRSHATVDLAEASDRVSLWLVERLFRKNWSILNTFHATRTRLLRNPIDKANDPVTQVRKFSMMGSAVTFPLQSIIFSMMAIAAVIYSKGQRVNSSSILRASRMIRVFGDDIIIPEYALESLVVLLKGTFLKVNEAKSFVAGPFRESCGMDAVGGYSVTPAYFLQDYEAQNPESVASVIESSNNFHNVGMWMTARFISERLPESIRRKILVGRIVPTFSWQRRRNPLGGYSTYQVDPGIRASLCFASFSGTSYPEKTRWSDTLHREEVHVLDLQQRIRRVSMDSPQCLLQYFTEAPDPEKLWASGKSTEPILSLRGRWVPAVRAG